MLCGCSGDEYVRVRSFRSALGLSDEDAAEVHLDVGKRLYSRAYEAKDRNAAFEQKKVRMQPLGKRR
jgi:Chloroplast envelope transporter